jgi:DNA-binding Lrp family transcriptional regulator
VKDIELRLIAELMKNSRRSDRELAKIIGVSQPTVSRTIKRLDKEEYIKEYTAIPDFTKLGFEIMSISFAKLKEPISEEKLQEIREQFRQTQLKEPISTIVAMSGMGCNADRVIIAFHENYSAYTEFLDKIRQHPSVDIEKISSFLINLNDRSHYRSLTLSHLADYITYKKRQESEGES